jgi:hypothetical protein
VAPGLKFFKFEPNLAHPIPLAVKGDAPMDGLDCLIDWCKRDRAKLQRQLATLEAVVADDATSTISRLRSWIAEIDAILALATLKD